MLILVFRCITTINANYETPVRGIKTSANLLASEIVKVPQFADSVSEGDIRFTKKVGDAVATDEVVMEIETDKTTVGVPSPGNGIIEEIFVQDGDTVKSNQHLFKINITGEAPKKAEAPAAAAAAPPPPPKPAAAAPPPPPAPAAPKPSAERIPPPPKPPTTPPPPPAKPTGPMATIPVAAIRHAQSIDSATVKVNHVVMFIVNACVL